MQRKLIPSVNWLSRKALEHIFEKPLNFLDRKMLEDGINEQTRRTNITNWEKRVLNTLVDLLIKNETHEMEYIKDTVKRHNISWRKLYSDLL